MVVCRKIKDRCAELGITYTAFYQRIAVRGWDWCKALTTPNQAGKGKTPSWIYNGRPVSEIVRERGLKYSTVRYRVKKMGWTLKRAIETPPTRKRKGKNESEIENVV